MRRTLPWIPGLLVLFVVATVLAAATATQAGLGDRLKKKLEEKTGKKADAAVEKATGGEDSGETKDAPGADAGSAPADGGKVSTVSTKFDYVPGDRVLLDDDFTQDELGEFPARWRLAWGNFEVAEKDGERWLRCTSPDGRVRMQVTGEAPLPEFYTLEFDLLGEEPMGSAFTVRGLARGDHDVWSATFPQGRDVAFRTGDVFSSTPLPEGASIEGRHHLMIMARGNSLKVYLDRERVANVPAIVTSAGPVHDLEIRLAATTRPMITNVRFAEGCRPPKDLLAEGKLVTYGIRFATGSDVVLPESAPVLRQVASYMEANPAVKLSITGHTDNVGTAGSNLDLSKRRAASVAKVLGEQFAIAGDRFTTDGKGDSQPVAANAKPEGRAMNRRVEFAKL